MLRIVVSSYDKGIGNFNEQWAKTSHCFQTECPLETAEPSRNYARVPGYKEKYKKKTRKRREKKRKMNGVEINTRAYARNQYERVRRYKITSTLGLLVRGDPQNEGLWGLLPRALGSKLDYLHEGITSTRLHRLCPKRVRVFLLKTGYEMRRSLKLILLQCVLFFLSPNHLWKFSKIKSWCKLKMPRPCFLAINMMNKRAKIHVDIPSGSRLQFVHASYIKFLKMTNLTYNLV